MTIKQNIAKDYLLGASGAKLSKKYNLHESTIYKYLKQLNIPIRSNKINSKKFFCDETFFSSINTEEKAYWLGFFYADGYQTKNNYFGFSLAEKDIDHLKKFNDAINSTYPIKEYFVTSGYKPGSPYCRLLIRSDKICSDLTTHGAFKNKTLILTYPKISEDLNKHFIRGYFDGDGSWTKDSKTKVGFQFKLCGTESFLNSVCEILDIPKKLYKKGNCFYISKAGQKVYDIMNYLYDDSTIYLERKYERYAKVKQSRQQETAE